MDVCIIFNVTYHLTLYLFKILSKSYHHVYVGKSTTTYWYFCSQSNILAAKPRKHEDTSKHRDTPSMERFDCNGAIKITINQSTNIAKLVLKHKLIHERPKDITVPQTVKEYIKENIDLLPREIYARLVDNDMNILIRQKQIHFWWSELGKNRYKRQDDAFESAIQWLKEGQNKIILEEIQPVRALAFMTEIHNYLLQMNINIRECGIDATCK